MANSEMPSRLNGLDNVPRPFIIGVCGGTASGKSSVCSKIVEQLGEDKVLHTHRHVVVISQDNFYRNLNPQETEKAYKGQFDFDHPDSLDAELMLQTMRDIKAGKTVQVPHYDFKTHSRVEGEHDTVYPADVVMFEGILIFYWKEFRDMFNMKLFVDSDPDTRLARRVLRDTKERARELDQVLSQYTKFVKPAFEEFCLPSKKYADVIIPRGAENTVAIDLIVQHIQELLRPKREQNGGKPVLKRLESDSGMRSRPH